MAVEPSARALVTVEEMALVLRDVDLDDDDTVDTIQTLINEASDYIHVDTGREFVWMQELYEATEIRTLAFTYGDVVPIGDVQEIDTVTINGVEVDAADYLLVPTGGPPDYTVAQLQINPALTVSAVAWPSQFYPRDVMTVEGTWGFAEVPDSVKRACKIIVESWYPLSGQVTSDSFDEFGTSAGVTTLGGQSRTFAVPLAAEQILSRFRRINRI